MLLPSLPTRRRACPHDVGTRPGGPQARPERRRRTPSCVYLDPAPCPANGIGLRPKNQLAKDKAVHPENETIGPCGARRSRSGRAVANTISACPGFSAHQTGLVMDVGNPNRACSLQACFENTPAGQFVRNHAWRYGFIIRCTWGNDWTTGVPPPFPTRHLTSYLGQGTLRAWAQNARLLRGWRPRERPGHR